MGGTFLQPHVSQSLGQQRSLLPSSTAAPAPPGTSLDLPGAACLALSSTTATHTQLVKGSATQTKLNETFSFSQEPH